MSESSHQDDAINLHFCTLLVRLLNNAVSFMLDLGVAFA